MNEYLKAILICDVYWEFKVSRPKALFDFLCLFDVNCFHYRDSIALDFTHKLLIMFTNIDRLLRFV
ncbi:CLUMA_CG012444, isoform A [Clunio marinus]|uniref:CLUMA_CG012444, isoform A n=1 Tax=Clunio marinus TaxID=568069 RepID=A0A1J1IGL7_9DIPT|nr:CLUMA_CG012444, isoform A [Clunio marinus]